jgi:hypothetical protein
VYSGGARAPPRGPGSVPLLCTLLTAWRTETDHHDRVTAIAGCIRTTALAAAVQGYVAVFIFLTMMMMIMMMLLNPWPQFMPYAKSMPFLWFLQ